MEVSAVAIENLAGDLDVVLGMDAIEQLGGVMVRNNGVDFGVGRCLMAQNEGYRAVTEREGPGGPQRVEDPAGALHVHDGEAEEAVETCTIEDKDFTAKFDGEAWTVTYLFKEDQGPILTNKVSCYERDLSGRKKGVREGGRPVGGRGHPDALGGEGGEQNTAAHGGRATDDG